MLVYFHGRHKWKWMKSSSIYTVYTCVCVCLMHILWNYEVIKQVRNIFIPATCCAWISVHALQQAWSFHFYFFVFQLSAWRKNKLSDSDLPWYLTRTAPAWGLMLWKRMEIWLLWLLTTKPLIRMDSLARTVFSLFRTSSKTTLSPSERFTFITWQKKSIDYIVCT